MRMGCERTRNPGLHAAIPLGLGQMNQTDTTIKRRWRRVAGAKKEFVRPLALTYWADKTLSGLSRWR